MKRTQLEWPQIATCAKHDGRLLATNADDVVDELAGAKDATSTDYACSAPKGDHAHLLSEDMYMWHNRNHLNRNLRNQNHLFEDMHDAIAHLGSRIVLRALNTLPNRNHHNKSQVSAGTRPQTMSGLFLLFCQT